MGDPPKPSIDPATLRIQAEAQAGRISSLQDRTGADTRDLLIRFGRSKAFGSGGGGATDGSLLAGAASAGLFGGRKLGVLSGLGGL